MFEPSTTRCFPLTGLAICSGRTCCPTGQHHPHVGRTSEGLGGDGTLPGAPQRSGTGEDRGEPPPQPAVRDQSSSWEGCRGEPTRVPRSVDARSCRPVRLRWRDHHQPLRGLRPLRAASAVSRPDSSARSTRPTPTTTRGRASSGARSASTSSTSGSRASRSRWVPRSTVARCSRCSRASCDPRWSRRSGGATSIHLTGAAHQQLRARRRIGAARRRAGGRPVRRGARPLRRRRRVESGRGPQARPGASTSWPAIASTSNRRRRCSSTTSAST